MLLLKCSVQVGDLCHKMCQQLDSVMGKDTTGTGSSRINYVMSVSFPEVQYTTTTTILYIQYIYVYIDMYMYNTCTF